MHDVTLKNGAVVSISLYTEADLNDPTSRERILKDACRMLILDTRNKGNAKNDKLTAEERELVKAHRAAKVAG